MHTVSIGLQSPNNVTLCSRTFILFIRYAAIQQQLSSHRSDGMTVTLLEMNPLYLCKNYYVFEFSFFTTAALFL